MKRAFPLLLVLAVAAVVPFRTAAAFDDDGDTVTFLLNSWIRAQGGREGFEGIHSFAVQEELETTGQPARTQVRFVETGSGHFRAETALPGAGLMVQAFDGRVGWKSHAGWGVGPLPDAEIGQLRSQADFLYPARIFRIYPRRTLLAGDTVAGRRCFAVSMSDGDRLNETWYLDKETSQLLRIDSLSPSGRIQYQVGFADYRRAGDLTLPFVITLSAGKAVTTIRRTSLLINPPVDESSFVLTMEQLREINGASAILARHAAISGSVHEASIHLNTRRIRASTESSANGLKTDLVILQKGPAILSRVTAPGLGETLQGFDGSEGWMQSDILGFHRLKPAEVESLRAQPNIVFFGNLGPSHPFRKLLGERVVLGRLTDAIALANMQGPDGIFYFDRETGRLVRVSPPLASAAFRTTLDFSDFRRVGEMEVPFVITVDNAAGRVVTRLQSIDNNPPLEDSLFEPKAPGL